METVLVTIVAAFGLFIVAQVATRPVRATVSSSHTAAIEPTQEHRGATAVAPDRADVGSTVLASTIIPPPTRNLEEIHAKVAAAQGTYVADLLDASGGRLVRWPDRTMQPLRVWMQPEANAPGGDSRLAPMARDAFTDWLDGSVPLRFDFVLDSASSDIRVMWIDRFPPSRGLQVGYTQRATDQYDWIASANIVVALHDSTGATLTPAELAGVVKHEVGHALGLGHSHNPETLMFPSERVTEIRAADRATLRLVYALPPGSAR